MAMKLGPIPRCGAFRAGSLLAVMVTAGCATGPVYPLMSPITAAQTFGYYEKPAENGMYQVSYVTPPLQALGYRFDTSPTTDSSKAMAIDLATLRAAQLAQQSGWQGFDIVDRHTSSDAEFDSGYWAGPWGGPGWGGPGWGGGWGWGWHHRFWGGWGGPGWDVPPEQRVQAEAILTVKFTNTLTPNDLRAADVVQQVTARYPGLMGAPSAATPAPAPKSST